MRRSRKEIFMAYLFSGQLCGYLCAECQEPLANLKVRLYRVDQQRNVAALAVANPKETFAILSDDQIREKESRLLAEAETDAQGKFRFELGENYAGEVFEVDVYCGSVPRQKAGQKPPKPRQFTITTLQPRYRETEAGFVAVWDYCLPYRFWCAVLALFDIWTICGHVTICQTHKPAAGVKVRAFDADWLADDELGSAFTDATGKFLITYSSVDFRQGTWIDVELIGGPDLYFRVEDSGGAPLLTETQARGRDPDRENAGNCFCVDLCIDVDQPPPTKYPWFTHVGDFHIYADIDATTGKTSSAAPAGITAHGGPSFGFYDGPYGYGLKLKGFCPKTHPTGGQPMRYRFLYEHPANPGIKEPLTGGRISPVVVGSRTIMWDLDGTGANWTFQTIVVAGSGATPAVTPLPSPLPPPGTPWGSVPTHVIVPDSDGWVIVDQTALDDGFYGPLIRFVSNSAVPGGAAPGNGAGNPLADPKSGAALSIYFEAEPVGGPAPGAPTLGNNLSKILINNWSIVLQLDLQQFQNPGSNCCSGLTNALDIKYTADHELMRSWSIGISSCASSLGGGWSPTPPALPSGTTPRGGIGTDSRNIAAWPSCSYTVTLGATRALTDGEYDDFGASTQLTFCK
jgi:hypothetical protein